MARLNLTRPRTFGIGLAVVSLAFAACSKSNTSPTPNPSIAPSAFPTATGSPNALSSLCANSVGIAYEPDAGNGGAFKGVQVTHFEDTNSNLCGVAAAPNALPPGVAFSAPVGPLAFSSDRSDAIAVLRNPSGSYTLAQDIFGAAAGSIVPVGNVYDLSAPPPTPAPAASSSGSPNPAPTPADVPLLADAQSIAIIGASSAGVALTTGLAAAGSRNAIVALTSLINAPPQYGSAVPFSGSSFTLKTIPPNPRSIVRIGIDAAQIVALVRGPQDLLSFAVTVVGSGYQFDAKAVDATLGSNVTLRGGGAIAFDPQNSGRALVGGTTAGGGSTLTLVTGLPNAIVKAATLGLSGTIRSIAITSNGSFGIVGTDGGIIVVKGVDTGTLSLVAPFAPVAGSSNASAPIYTTCTGAVAALSSIYSVAVSQDQHFLVALGTAPGVACPSGYNASIVAVPFSTSSGTSPTPAPSTAPSPGSTVTPAPTIFVQNNVIAPPPGADYFYAY